MNTPVFVEVIASAAAVVVAALSYLFTKMKEREADWRKWKYEQYKEFVLSMSSSLGEAASIEGQLGFAKAWNALHLIGSPGVLGALHDFQNLLTVPIHQRLLERHDVLLSRLIWEIRKDMKISGTPRISKFSVHVLGPSRELRKQDPSGLS